MMLKVKTTAGFSDAVDLKVKRADGTFADVQKLLVKKSDGTFATVWTRESVSTPKGGEPSMQTGNTADG